jgi:hypothetical protein
MTDVPEHVVVPYARFLEIQQRRQRMTTELVPHDPDPTVETAGADEPPPTDVAVARPLP